MTNQPVLFHESILDALGTLVNALGGPMKVGPRLWPEKTLDAAAQLVRDCLNPTRKERFDPEQTLLLLKWGKQVGCHEAINYICFEAGYDKPPILEPEDELARLQREYIEAVKLLSQLTPKIEEQRSKLQRVV
jgi:hypothetical protein